MKKEKLLIYPVQITRRAEVKCFQIKMPRDAKAITGILTSLRGLEYIGQFIVDPPMYEFLRARFIMHAGHLSLRCAGKENSFFNQNITLHDNNIGQGDFSQSMTFHSTQWKHGSKREKTPLMLSEDICVLFGTYEDRYARLWDNDFQYTVNIYLWYCTE